MATIRQHLVEMGKCFGSMAKRHKEIADAMEDGNQLKAHHSGMADDCQKLADMCAKCEKTEAGDDLQKSASAGDDIAAIVDAGDSRGSVTIVPRTGQPTERQDELSKARKNVDPDLQFLVATPQ
jgi:hypothetical protein